MGGGGIRGGPLPVVSLMAGKPIQSLYIICVGKCSSAQRSTVVNSLLCTTALICYFEYSW